MRTRQPNGLAAAEALAPSAVLKRSVVVNGHKTSISLEDAFWDSLKEIARHRGVMVSTMIAAIDGNRQHTNLSSAIRLFVLEHFRARALASVLIGQRSTAPVAPRFDLPLRSASGRGQD